MSSTNSSDRLTLLSYATFNYHIPIHNHSWRQHHWKQTETKVALASLALKVDFYSVNILMTIFYIKTVRKFSLPLNHPSKIQPDKNNVLQGIKMPLIW